MNTRIICAVILILSLYSCQYKNAEELYYSNEVIGDKTSKILVDLSFDGKYSDKSESNTEIKVHGEPSYTSNRFNQENRALSLNGQNQYIEFDLGRRDSLSVSLWFNCASYSSNFSSLFDYGRNAVKTNIDGFTGPTSFNVSSFYNNLDQLYANYKFRFNQWYHIYVCAGKENALYVNGKKVGLIEKHIVLNLTNTNILIGKSVPNDPKYEAYFHGAIDDIKVFNYPLSPSEIKSLYNSPQSN